MLPGLCAADPNTALKRWYLIPICNYVQGRYVCCDAQGCDGFNADNLTPHCKNFGYVPPNFGELTGGPPQPPTGGDQGKMFANPVTTPFFGICELLTVPLDILKIKLSDSNFL